MSPVAPRVHSFASSLAGDHKSQLFLLDEFNKMYCRERSPGKPSDWRARLARINSSQSTFRCTNVPPRINLFLVPDVHTRRWYSMSTLRPLIDRGVVERRNSFPSGCYLSSRFLCFWLAYHIAAPIHNIQSAARRVAQGDLSARVPHAVSLRRDELAALGNGLRLDGGTD